MNFKLIQIYLFSICLQSSLQELDCDFENDFCNYKTTKFERNSGNSFSIPSGPLMDRTKKNGLYALCNGKSLRNNDDECIMEKTFPTKSKELTLEFWFFSYGSNMSKLRVFINSDRKQFWSNARSRKNSWTLASVNLPSFTHKIEFRANISINDRLSSVIAIDDIIVYDEDFNFDDEKPSKIKGEHFNKFGVLNGWHTNFKNYEWVQTDGSDVNMGPLSDYDSIANYHVGSFNMKKMTKNYCAIPYTLESSNGSKEYYCRQLDGYNGSFCGLKYYPKVSHYSSIGRCHKGYYMTISSDFYEGDKSFRSRLISPLFMKKENDNFYLSFAYNIVSSDNLQVILEWKNKTSNFSKIILKIDQAPDDYSWSIIVLEIKLTSCLFRVIFEPIRDSSNKPGSISIDSFDIYYGDFWIEENFKESTKENIPGDSVSHSFDVTTGKKSDRKTEKSNSITEQISGDIGSKNIVFVSLLLVGVGIYLIFSCLVNKYKPFKQTATNYN